MTAAGLRDLGRARLGGAEVDLALLVNGFPRLSETFVLQELLDLERRGLRLALFALSRPDEIVRQEDLDRLRARVEYVPDKRGISRPRVARAHAALLRKGGADYRAAIRDVTGAPDWTRGTGIRAALLASRLIRLGSPPLYIHFAHKPGTIGRLASRLAGVPYALSCHAKDIWLTPPEELGPKLAGAEVVLTCTAAGQRELERHAAGAAPVLLAYHGVDTDVAAVQRARPLVPRVLTVGRLVEKKGHDVLIRAAALLRERDLSFTLRIAGEGPEWARLQRLVHELDVGGHVTFLGPLTPLEVKREYEAASVFALGCRQLPNGDRDGLPNVVLEAMARELPVLTTTQGAAAEAVDDGRTGILVGADDPAAMARALGRILTSPGLAADMGRAGRASVRERFDRVRLLPAVAEALTEAGLIAPSMDRVQEEGAASSDRKAA